MKQSLNLELTQSLTLTPQLKQSLKLLQLAAFDLRAEIQKELESNPLLEQVETTSNNELSFADEQANQNNEPQTSSDNEDADWQEAFESRRTLGSASTSQDSNDISHYVSKEESLLDHLLWQVRMTALSDKDRLIAKTLIHCMDDEGYLELDPGDIQPFFATELDVETDEIIAVLNLIKTLDPIGAGARNLNERLLILLNQVKDSPAKELAKDIINEHLDLLGSRNLAQLRGMLSANDADINRAIELITTLNPRINTAFQSKNTDYIIPDIMVKKVDELWVADLNPDNYFRLKTNSEYSKLLQTDLDKTQTDYIQENLQNAKNFIKGLNSRYDTMLLVAQAIVDQQQAFFEQGETEMKPLIMQDIAARLGLHESTISRATSGKYMISPRGIHELKFFFSTALSNASGEATSSVAMRSIIKKLIDNEPKNKPLSDNKIAQELEQQGHVIARRTVAKYRESMQIPPSSQRKALF